MGVMMMSILLVTGGAGFIGSNFIHYWLEKNKTDQIINYDALTYAGNLENLKDLESMKNYQFIQGDITDEKRLTAVFKEYNIDYVVHFAAESHVDRSIKDPSIFIRTNVLGTQILLESAKRAWMTGDDDQGYPTYLEGVRFLHVSTDEVYGDLGPTGFFLEASPLIPNSPYSSSKASSDLIVRAYNRTFKLPTVITRCSNNYGPYQYPEKLIPLMISNAIENKGLPIYGDGKQIRDWLYVKDHCCAIETVLKTGNIGDVYNIGGNNEKTNIEIVQLILKTLDKTENLIQYVEDRLGHDRRYAIDNKKITTQLDWQPRYSFEEGMKETIKWYIEHPNWLKNIQS